MDTLELNDFTYLQFSDFNLNSVNIIHQRFNMDTTNDGLEYVPPNLQIIIGVILGINTLHFLGIPH